MRFETRSFWSASYPVAGSGLPGAGDPPPGSALLRWLTQLLRGAGGRPGDRDRSAVRRRVLQELSRSLALIVDTAGIESCVASRLRELFVLPGIAILHADPARRALVPGFVSGLGEAGPGGTLELRFDLDGRLVRWLRTNEAALRIEAGRGPWSYLEPAERALLLRLDVVLAVPLLSRNRVSGLLLLRGAAGAGRDWPSRDDLDLLQLIAGQAALALENAAAYQLERERLRRLYRAERLALAGQLAAGVAHEIRNPLTAIRSTLQYILGGMAGDDPKRVLAAESLAEADRINGTIRELLCLAQPLPPQLSAIDPAEPLRQALTLITAQAAAQCVALDLQDLRGAPGVLDGDPEQLKQVFLNLLLNALATMPDGGRLAVTLADLPGTPPSGGVATDGVRIAIADSGPGIDPALRERVFEPFFTTRHEGTGLGLAICRGIVERHGGEIGFVDGGSEGGSKKGSGATIEVRLPGG